MKDQQGRAAAVAIPGDGIGPEIMESVFRVMTALGSPFEFTLAEAGEGVWERTGDPLPRETLDASAKAGLVLKGPLGTPSAGGFRSATVRMREEFDLFANVRPVKTFLPGRYDGVDVVLFRENLEGLYVGKEHWLRVGDDQRGMGVAMGINSRRGMERFLRYAFAEAVRLGRRKVTVVHKANILKILSGLFLEVARDVGKERAGELEFEEMIVDACAMNLVLRPERFDVIVTTNLFGDVLSDLCAGLVGGLGLAPGANVGDGVAMFEAVHGTAPDIAGQGRANPSSLLLASAMMLGHAGFGPEAARLRAALEEVLLTGHRTGDLGGTLGTAAFTDALVRRIEDR